MKIQIINGPNLNLLGKREPTVYGNKSFEDFFIELKSRFKEMDLHYYQSNVEGEIINKFGIRGVIGKGGMGDKTLAACQECGCVYLHAVGGAAQVLAECVKKVRNVYLLEKFGSPEAIWELEVERFPAVVTMDAHGNSLHREIFAASQAELAKRL